MGKISCINVGELTHDNWKVVGIIPRSWKPGEDPESKGLKLYQDPKSEEFAYECRHCGGVVYGKPLEEAPTQPDFMGNSTGRTYCWVCKHQIGSNGRTRGL